VSSCKLIKDYIKDKNINKKVISIVLWKTWHNT